MCGSRRLHHWRSLSRRRWLHGSRNRQGWPCLSDGCGLCWPRGLWGLRSRCGSRSLYGSCGLCGRRSLWGSRSLSAVRLPAASGFAVGTCGFGRTLIRYDEGARCQHCAKHHDGQHSAHDCSPLGEQRLPSIPLDTETFSPAQCVCTLSRSSSTLEYEKRERQSMSGIAAKRRGRSAPTRVCWHAALKARVSVTLIHDTERQSQSSGKITIRESEVSGALKVAPKISTLSTAGIRCTPRYIQPSIPMPPEGRLRGPLSGNRYRQLWRLKTGLPTLRKRARHSDCVRLREDCNSLNDQSGFYDRAEDRRSSPLARHRVRHLARPQRNIIAYFASVGTAFSR